MNKIAGRYEVKSKLGEGGMGVVYRAYDPPPMDREVAVKTLHEFEDPMALELFYKECTALKSISHPNIVEIFDMGESEPGGQGQPFFVMPLLPGQTLDELIRKASHRLTVERVVEIFVQTCRGLQAAHERGLVHRDLKPSNIFVMADDSVKIIDFGVAHAVHAKTRTTGYQKGTLLYMAPEQVQHKPISVQSDVYSLGVTLYEALTRRQPFRNATEDAVIQAILSYIPPPASDINPAVSHVISRVVHKAMAKQPWNRFDSARDLGETLLKAHRNEPIAIFDSARLQPRIQTATKALEKGDYQFAGEIVSELEAEGNIDPQITMLRAEIDQIARQKTVAQLLESARARYEEEEDPLALQKLQEVLQMDPTNMSALGLKSKIEDRRSERQIEKWIQLAQQHASNRSYGHAREALQNALMLRPKDPRASRLLKEIETDEQNYMRLRKEKTELYQKAVNAWKNGEVSQALSQMKHVLELDREAPDVSSPDAASTYQSFYNKIRSEHESMNNGYAEARRHLADKDFLKALEICRSFLEKYPGQALFQALKFDIDEQQRQRLSSFIADVDRRLEAEADLDAKLSLVKEAASEFPDEDHFKRLVKLHQDKRDLVNSIVERARLHESGGQITEALSDLETLRTIYGAYPGLSFEKERLQKRLEQQSRDAARAQWARQVDAQLQQNDYARANELLDKADAEFPGDLELAELRKLARQGIDRSTRADELVAEGQKLCESGQFEQGIDLLKIALDLDDRTAVRMTLRDLVVGRAQATFDADWHAAEGLIEYALELDPNHALAKSLRSRALDKRREEAVGQAASQARRLQADGNFDGAMAEVEKGLASYPADTRLTVIKDALKKEISRAAPPPPPPPPPPALSQAQAPEPEPADIEKTRIVSARSADSSARAVQSGAEKTRIVARPDAPAQKPVSAPATAPKKAAASPPPMLWIGIAAVLVVVVGGWLLWPAPDPPPPPPADVKLSVSGLTPGTNVSSAGVLVGTIGQDGTLNATLPAGTRELTFDLAGFLPKTVPVNPGESVTLTDRDVVLEAEAAQMGTLRILGLPTGARVSLDGQNAGVVTPEGTLEAKGTPGSHALIVEAKGFNTYSAPITLSANQASEIQAKDVLTREVVGTKPPPPPPPAVPARLRLVQFPADTQVTIDTRPPSPIPATGLFEDIPAGTARPLQFQRPGYEVVRTTRDFTAGGTVTVALNDLPWSRLPATVIFTAPRGTGVRVLQNKAAVATFTVAAPAGHKQQLPEGTYQVVAKGAMPDEWTDEFTVAAGETVTINLRTVGGMEGFSSGWGSLPNGWSTRTGGGNVLYERAGASEIRFTISLVDQKGRRFPRANPFSGGSRLKWVLGWTDSQNYTAFQLDRSTLYRQDIRGGKMDAVFKTAHAIPVDGQFVYLKVEISETAVVHKLTRADGTDTVIDRWVVPPGATARALVRGQFGFQINDGEEIGIANFKFYPARR